MLLFWLLLLATGGAEANYPPDGVTLLQNSSLVRLHWNLQGQAFRVLAWGPREQICDLEVHQSSQEVEVPRGQPVRWRVVSNTGERFDSSFSIADKAEYHCDGNPGLAVTRSYHGLGGTGAGDLRIRLSRDGAGLHMFLWHPNGMNHYLFAESGLKFAVSAHGGDGAPGLPGEDGTRYADYPTAGGPGTQGGNGGHVIISTASTPWQEVLDVDVSPGKGGKGGAGGHRYEKKDERAPDGPAGRDGFPGRVDTVIQDGW